MINRKHGQPKGILPIGLGEAARRGARLAGVLLLAGSVAACSAGAVITKHGHHIQQSELQQIQPGMTRDEVQAMLGTPTTTSSVGTGDAFYYISSTTKQVSFFEPEEIDRRVVAVYFNQTGMVERVAEYGLQDGKIFDFISRTTPSANTKDEGLLKQLFRNLGRRGAIFGE